MTHPYVAHGASGLLKVGHTINVAKRLTSLKKEFRKKGDELVRIEHCEALRAGRVVESRLIQHCRKHFQKHSGWEWFTGANFDQVFALAIAETEVWKSHVYREWTPPTEEEMEATRARNAARKEAARISLERRRALIARRSAAFQAKRHKSERVIAAFVAFAISSTETIVPIPEQADEKAGAN